MVQKIRQYGQEAVNIIQDLIANNELVNGKFISYVGCNTDGSIITIRDILQQESQYNLSEVSYVFTDYLDCFGDMNKNVYNTVLDSKDSENYEENKESFMKALLRLRKIEQIV